MTERGKIHHGTRNMPRRPRRGAVLFIVLAAMTLLVGLAFFVLNAGTQVNRRLELQNTADSTAMGGANWMARGMNVVAIDNVGMARMIMMSAMLDSMPLAAEMTIAEETGAQSLPLALKRFKSLGPAYTRLERDNFFRRGLQEIYNQMQEAGNDTTDLDLVKKIDESFDQADELATEDGYDVAPTTQWEYKGTVQYVIDDADGGFSTTGSWRRAELPNQYSKCCYLSTDAGAKATWVKHLPKSDNYIVYARWPESTELTQGATYTVTYAGGEKTVVLNQTKNGGKWVKLGEYAFDASTPAQVTLTCPTSDPQAGTTTLLVNVAADAIKFVATSGELRRGYVWRAALAMDKLSQATVKNLPDRVAQNANVAGESNDASIAFTLPLKAALPCERFDFSKFETVVVDNVNYDRETATVRKSDLVDYLYNSDDPAQDARRKTKSDGTSDTVQGWGSYGDYVSGGAIPDFSFPYRLGPFASLYRWRFPWDSYQYSFHQRTGYSSYGPYESILRNILDNFGQAGWFWSGDWQSDLSKTSRFAFHLRTLTKIKLAMMFKRGRGDPNPQQLPVQYSDEWITDYDSALEYYRKERDNFDDKMREYQQAVTDAIANQTPIPEEPKYISKIVTTRYYEAVVKSTIPWDSAEWMDPSVYDDSAPTNTFVPKRWFTWQLEGKGPYINAKEFPLHRWERDFKGWVPMHAVSGSVSPSSWSERQWYEIAPRVWARKWKTTVDYDVGYLSYGNHLTGLNLPIRYVDPNDPTKGTIPYTIYYFQIRVFGGAEMRNEVTVSDPLHGADPADLPAPILLDTSKCEYNDTGDMANHSSYLRFMGVASRTAPARVWPGQFTLGNPTGRMTAVAEAVVFNNSSWDLWTQDWRAQLVPVSGWAGWQSTMAQQVSDVASEDTKTLENPDDVQKTLEYLMTLDPQFMDLYLDH